MGNKEGFVLGEAEARQLLANSRIAPDNPQYKRLHRIAAASYALKASDAPAWMIHSLIEQVLPELASEFDHQWRKFRGLESRAIKSRQLRAKYLPEFQQLSGLLGKSEAARRVRRQMERDGVRWQMPSMQTIRRWPARTRQEKLVGRSRRQ